MLPVKPGTTGWSNDNDVVSWAQSDVTTEYPESLLGMLADNYHPFARRPYPAGVRTIEAADILRNRVFPCEIWYPAAPEYVGRDPAVVSLIEEAAQTLTAGNKTEAVVLALRRLFDPKRE